MAFYRYTDIKIKDDTEIELTKVNNNENGKIANEKVSKS